MLLNILMPGTIPTLYIQHLHDQASAQRPHPLRHSTLKAGTVGETPVNLTASLLHVLPACDRKLHLVLLVTPKPRVTHEVQREVVRARLRRRGKVKLDLGGARQVDALDGQQGVGLGVAHHQPPALVLAAGEARRGHRAQLRALLHLALQPHHQAHRLARRHGRPARQVVRDRNVGVAVAHRRHLAQLLLAQPQQLAPRVILQVHQVKHAAHACLPALGRQLAGEVRQLQQRRVLVPQPLRHALGQLHGHQRGRQPPGAGHAVHHRLQQPHRLGDHRLLVDHQVARQRGAAKVRLQQRVGLDVRVCELLVVHRHGGVRQQLAHRLLLAGPHRQRVKLGRGADDLQQTLDLRLGRQARRKQLDGGVGDVVVRGDHAQVEGRDVHVVLDRDRLGALQVAQRRLHQLRQVVAQVPVARARHGVKVRVQAQAAVEERPGQVVHRVLLVLNRARHHLGVEVVVQEVVQVRLDRQRLQQEALVVLLARRVAQQCDAARVVLPRPPRAPQHLDEVRHRVVAGASARAVVRLRAAHHHRVRGRRHAPRARRRGHHHRDGAALKQQAHHALLRGRLRLGQQAHAVRQRVAQRLVAHAPQERLNVGRLRQPEP
mmetsp:Transcript_30308/g.77305  ORF Transcript_30308/g.77305 Transcript_30308/m.77305 type:complete len:603 (-) Transcript_30308:4987-6795(-)